MMIKFISILTIVCYCIQLVSSSGASETKVCKHNPKCRCNPIQLNCSGSQLTTEDLAEDFPTIHRDVYLSHNLLTALDYNHISSFHNVQDLFLQYNDLNYIDHETFKNNKFLTRVDLSHNVLSTLHPDMFASNPNVSTVNLSYNQIVVIPDGLFNHLANLKHLRLNNNKITSIPDGAFQATIVLDNLYLEYNLLETARWKWINHFDLVESEGYEMYFDNNPFSCDCRMAQFYNKIKSKNWNVTGDHKSIEWPTCASPPQLKGTNLQNVNNVSNLVCDLPAFEEPHQQYNFGSNEEVTITCSHHGLPTPIVFITGFQGHIVSEVKKGSVNYTLDREEYSNHLVHNATYICNANGTNASNHKKHMKQTIFVTVIHEQSSTMTVLLALLLCIIIAVGIILFVRQRRNNPKGYGSLSNETHLDDVSPVADAATPLAVGATTAALDAESDEECMRYSKDDEDKEFLV